MAEKDKRRRKRTFVYLWVLLALLVLLVTASYTWFSLSQTPRVNDMAIYVNADSGLELALAHDAPDGEWTSRLDFVDVIDEECPLKPVTWSEARQSLVTVRYGFDGRATDDLIPLTDERNANRRDDYGYYVEGTFYARTVRPCSVSFAEAVELNEGEDGAGTYVLGKPVWDPERVRHVDGGLGAELALRLGLRITHVDPKTGEAKGDPEFFIYEPNCDTHVNEPGGYVPTPSIDGGGTLIDESHLILQKTSSWTEADPVEHGVTVKTLGEFVENRRLFALDANDTVKIELYVWLDGQDVDCVSRIDRAYVTSNIQFHVDYTGYQGYENIPDDQP